MKNMKLTAREKIINKKNIGSSIKIFWTSSCLKLDLCDELVTKRWQDIKWELIVFPTKKKFCSMNMGMKSIIQ